ncbi:MAG: protein kinase, partial [Candidatus Latescibacteria bacterium]|nr:protein kinase [Candidatus Latescibacterota bacterium]
MRDDAIPCPDPGDLERWRSGALSEAETGRVAQHLDACDECRARLDEVVANLSFLDRVRDDLPARVPRARPHPETIGAFRILDELGRGGMGIVYLAEQSRPARKVAVKVLRTSTGSLAERFENEAHVLAQLHHPGIAQVYEVGV